LHKKSLRKDILFELDKSNCSLSYDEIATRLNIKVRKRLTDTLTVLRKKMFISQNGNSVSITHQGREFITEK
jgi:predicted transcriptional regulator